MVVADTYPHFSAWEESKEQKSSHQVEKGQEVQKSYPKNKSEQAVIFFTNPNTISDNQKTSDFMIRNLAKLWQWLNLDY